MSIISENKIKRLLTVNSGRKIVLEIIRWYFLINVTFIILYPLIYMLSMSFRSPSDFYDVTVVWIPKSFTFSNFKKVIFEMNLWGSMGNSAIISVSCTILQVFIAALTGYGFARFKFKGSNTLFMMVIATIMMPPQMINIPLYLIMKNLDFFGIFKALTGTVSPINLINTPLAFIIPALFGQGFRAGLFILIFRQYFLGIPVELEEAATIDGCGYFRSFLSVIMPNAKTPMIISGTFALVWYWSDYYGPYVFLTSIRTLSVQLMDFHSLVSKYLPLSQQTWYYKIPLQQAACIFSILPLIILFVFTQKFFTQGLERSGIVG